MRHAVTVNGTVMRPRARRRDAGPERAAASDSQAATMPTRPARRERLWRVGLATAGVALLAGAVVSLGVAPLLAHLVRLSSVLPVVLLLAAVRYLLQAMAWQLAMPVPDDQGLTRLTLACVVGETASYLTFAGPFAAVPARALLVCDRLAVREGMAAAALERACFLVTGALMVGVASALIAGRQAGKAHTWVASALVLGGAVACLAAVVLVVTMLARASRRWLAPSLPRRALPAMLCLVSAQHLLAFAEAWLMLRALGWHPDLRHLFIFEALMKLVNGVGTFVPAGIGVHETGSALLGAAVGFGAATGLALGVMRRVRALIVCALGLLLFSLWRTDTRPAHAPEAR
jgi:hypothetical protein